VAGASKRLEIYLENLTPWQPKKLYFFSDADDQKQFAGTGPAYSVKEISPSQKKPYWRLAIDSATPHLTQFPEEIHQMTAMSDEQINKFMDDPQHSWWTEPMTLIFAKAAEPTPPWRAIFADLEPRQPEPPPRIENYSAPTITYTTPPSLALGIAGPWGYYEAFRSVHQMKKLPVARGGAEIGVKSGSVLTIPLMVTHKADLPREIIIKVNLPSGWKLISGEGKLRLPDEETTPLRVEAQTPDVPAKDLKNSQPESIRVEGINGNTTFGSVGLRVLLRPSALPQ
jgi:hypothetical protein